MSISIREGLQRQLESYQEGTVVRWVSSGQYSYAALKTPAGWFTTARAMPDYAQRTPQVADNRELALILTKKEVSKVFVATEWQHINSVVTTDELDELI